MTSKETEAAKDSIEAFKYDFAKEQKKKPKKQKNKTKQNSLLP